MRHEVEILQRQLEDAFARNRAPSEHQEGAMRVRFLCLSLSVLFCFIGCCPHWKYVVVDVACVCWQEVERLLSQVQSLSTERLRAEERVMHHTAIDSHASRVRETSGCTVTSANTVDAAAARAVRENNSVHRSRVSKIARELLFLTTPAQGWKAAAGNKTGFNSQRHHCVAGGTCR